MFSAEVLGVVAASLAKPAGGMGPSVAGLAYEVQRFEAELGV